jgi:hypothetical protein
VISLLCLDELCDSADRFGLQKNHDKTSDPSTPRQI